MGTITFFDTETTGLVEHRASYDDPRQPWPVSIAAIDWCDGKIVREYKTLVRLPPGTVIHPKAQEVHGISFEQTQEEGMPIGEVLDLFTSSAHASDYHAAYNLPFDDKVMRALAHRVNPSIAPEDVTGYLYGSSKAMCVMELTRTLLRIPSSSGFGFRNIKLGQAYKRVCKKDLIGAHDAMADTRAAMEIFVDLLKITDERKKSLTARTGTVTKTA